ncbi:MAG TPA: hypothetical protein VGD37_11705 [Kofleriaceae bacterium]
MDAAEQLVPMETEPLPRAEICARYPDQFVCLAEVVPVELRGPEIRRRESSAMASRAGLPSSRFVTVGSSTRLGPSGLQASARSHCVAPRWSSMTKLSSSFSVGAS